MDALSQLVATMRTGEPASSLITHHAPWHRSYPPVQGAGIHVILQGSAVLLSSGTEPVALGVGDVVFTPQGAGHALADSATTPLPGVGTAADTAADGDGPTTVLLCGAYGLDRSRVHPMLLELPEYVHLPARLGHHPSLRAAIDLLGREVQDRRPGTDAAIPALLDMLLLFILRAWTDDQDCDEGSGWAAALRDRPVSTALSAIHRNPGHPWTVESLGTEAGLSRAAFARRFAALVGQPPLAYLTWWRLTTAARLLRETDSSLHSVAQRVGYASEFAFANAFKREFGTAPGAYRRRG
ncbi:AraC family transcriptional regulator [Actinopolymorpha singaporensis]